MAFSTYNYYDRDRREPEPERPPRPTLPPPPVGVPAPAPAPAPAPPPVAPPAAPPVSSKPPRGGPPAPQLPGQMTPGLPAPPNLGQTGTGTQEQRTTGALPSGTFPDDNPDAGSANTGDPYLDELRSGRVAGSEDWRRFSNAVLKSWEQYYIGGGRFRNVYGDIVGKPIDSGPNTPAGKDGLGKDIVGYAGGRGGGGGGGGSSQFSASAGGPGGLESDTVWQSIQARLKGDTRYTPEVMDRLLGELRSGAEGAAGRAGAEAEADMARRGLSRSSLAATAQREIRTSMYGDVLRSQAALARAKIDADFQDKSQAISDGLNWLNSLRSYVASMTATRAQKAVAMANIQLGYQQLQHQTDMMREQYAQRIAELALTE